MYISAKMNNCKGVPLPRFSQNLQSLYPVSGCVSY